MRKFTIAAINLSALGMMLMGNAQAQQTPAASPQPAPAANAGQAPAAGAPKAPTAKPAAAAKPGTAVPFTLKTQKDKVSYAVGMNIGKGVAAKLKQQSVDVSQAVLLRGMKDALAGGKMLLTEEEERNFLTQLSLEARKKQEEQMKLAAEPNKKIGEEFLAANKVKDGVVTLPSGLQYKILTEGTGPKPAASDTVLCNYRGTLINGTEFDSSYKRGQPLTIQLNRVIRGWGEALQLMPVGSKWQLFIPPDLGYGDPGQPPTIGPGVTLIFEVELLSIQGKDKTEAPPK
jgi:FKBP-type peptidyl-prolyl cis-trans isomerase FklB